VQAIAADILPSLRDAAQATRSKINDGMAA
jgi:hypothetical protein